MRTYVVIEPNLLINWGRDRLHVIGMDDQFNLILSKQRVQFDKDNLVERSYGDFIKPCGVKHKHGCLFNRHIIGYAGPKLTKLASELVDENAKADWIPKMMYNLGVKDHKSRFSLNSDGTVNIDPTVVPQLFAGEGGLDWRPWRRLLDINEIVNKAKSQDIKDHGEETRIQRDLWGYKVYQLVEHKEGYGLKEDVIQTGVLKGFNVDIISKVFLWDKKVKVYKSRWNHILKEMKDKDASKLGEFGTVGSVQIELINGDIHNWFDEDQVEVMMR